MWFLTCVARAVRMRMVEGSAARGQGVERARGRRADGGERARLPTPDRAGLQGESTARYLGSAVTHRARGAIQGC